MCVLGSERTRHRVGWGWGKVEWRVLDGWRGGGELVVGGVGMQNKGGEER